MPENHPGGNPGHSDAHRGERAPADNGNPGWSVPGGAWAGSLCAGNCGIRRAAPGKRAGKAERTSEGMPEGSGQAGKEGIMYTPNTGYPVLGAAFSFYRSNAGFI